MEVGGKVCTQGFIASGIVGQGEVLHLILVPEIGAEHWADTVFWSQSNEIPIGGSVVDIGQRHRSDADGLCFGQQLFRTHQPIAQAEPRMAMQMHGARIRRTETLVRLNGAFEHGIPPFQTTPSLRVWRSRVLGKSAARWALTNWIHWPGDLGFQGKWGRH